jgi:enterochelin esterase-like enzyme
VRSVDYQGERPRLATGQVPILWLLGAMILLLGCSMPADTPSRHAPATAALAATTAALPDAPTGTLRPLGRRAAEPGAEPRPAEALPEWVGPLWGRFRAERFYSDALDREMPYFVYSPPAAEHSSRGLPVLYMLHGASGDNSEWATIKLIDWADRLIANQEIPPLVVVLPQGDFGYWVNHVDEGPRWGDYLVEDVVGEIDASYPTLPIAAARAVGGLSQGGHAALQLSFNYPEVFGVAGAHSPSLRAEEDSLPWLGTGDEFARRDPIALAETLPAATLARTRLSIDVGSDDPWRPRVELLHAALAERGVSHEWHVWPGGHDGDYWQPNVPAYLRYYGRALRAAIDGG